MSSPQAGNSSTTDEQDRIGSFLRAVSLSGLHNDILASLPEGDERRGSGLWRIAGLWFLHFTETKSIPSITHAIQFAAQTLEESRNDSENYCKYLTGYFDFLESKTRATGAVEDFDAWIAACKSSYESVRNDRAREEALCSLGVAYYCKFDAKRNWQDLDLAVDTLASACGSATYERPSRMIDLGSVYLCRWPKRRSTDDLHKAVEWLHRGLTVGSKQDPKQELHGHWDVLSTHGLEVLGIAAEKLFLEQPTAECQEQMIARTTEVLAVYPADYASVPILRLSQCRMIMRRLLKEPSTVTEYRENLQSPLIDEELNENQDVVRAKPFALSPRSAKRYCYRPLQDDKHDIRLMTVLPGAKGEVLKCEIAAYKIEEAPKYEALSYVWGDAKDTVCVGLDDCAPMDKENGRFLNITRSLFHALARFRRLTSTRTFWVDAVCIDQSNSKEKSHQVMMMADIYRRADVVILWLGEMRQITSPIQRASSEVVATPSHSSKTIESAADEPHTAKGSKDYEREVARSLLQNQELRTELLKLAREEIEWLSPVFFGSKVMSFSRQDVVLSDDHLRRVVEQITTFQAYQLEFYNTRFRSGQPEPAEIMDWTVPDNIPSILRTAQTRSTWPVLGAVSLLYCLAHDLHMYDLPFFDGDPNQLSEGLSYSQSTAWYHCAQTLVHDILSNPYWSRAWILQETVVARCARVHFGPHVFPFDWLVKAQESFSIHYQGCCARAGMDAFLKQHTWWTQIFDGLKKFETLHRLRTAFDAREEHNADPSLLSILNLLTCRGRRQASDERDLVFSLLALAGKGCNIVSDYSLTVAQVFSRLASTILDDQKGLWLLTMNDLGHHEEMDLPTWVPDWSAWGYPPLPYQYDLFDASYGRMFHAVARGDRNLEIETIMVDKIVKISSTRTVSWDRPEKLVTLMREWHQMSEDHHEEFGINDGLLREERFWLACFAGIIEDNDGVQSSRKRYRRWKSGDDLIKILKWYEWFLGQADEFVGTEWYSLISKAHDEGFHLITDSFWRSTESRKLIFTERGNVGSGPASTNRYSTSNPDACVEDEIHVAAGCRLPIILRPTKEDSTFHRPRTYEFVGPCYVDEFMDGHTMFQSFPTWSKVLLC